MHGGEGYVDGVASGFFRNDVFDEEVFGERIGFGCVGKLRDASEFLHPLCGESGVPFFRFATDHAGDEQLVVLPLQIFLIAVFSLKATLSPLDENH